MSTFDEVDYLREKAGRLSVGLSLRLGEYVNEFPAGAPAKLIEILKAFLSGIDIEVTKTSDIQLLRQYCGLVNELGSFLDCLDNAHTAQTPKGLVQLLEQTAQALYSNAVLFVSPSSKYNYSIVDIVPPFRQTAASSLSASSRAPLEAMLPTSFYIVRFPRVERESILNAAIFGHEFGHPIASEFLNAHEQVQTYKDRLKDAQDKVQNDPGIATALNAYKDPLVRSQHLNKLVETVTKLHKRGLEELISDAVGAYLLGPSALFASLDVLNQNSLDSPPSFDECYPPSRYRIRLTYDLLETTGDLGVLRGLTLNGSNANVANAIAATLDYIKSLRDNQADKTILDSMPVTRIAYEWIELTLTEAKQFCQARIGSAAFPTQQTAQELPELLRRLELQVPANEIGIWPNIKSVDWRSSILAGWLLYYGQISNTSGNAKDRRVRLVTTQKLAAKSVEYAILRKEYEAFLAKRAAP